MAGTLTVSTISDGTNSTSATNCIKGSAKAWVNFNGGSGNTAGVINASYNVSSITVVGTGSYTINYTSALANTNYVMSVTPYGGATSGLCVMFGTYSTTATDVQARTTVNINQNPVTVLATVFTS